MDGESRGRQYLSFKQWETKSKTAVEEAGAITVLMAVHNDERYIQASLESILNQSFSNIRILIINDCGTDGTLGIIKSYKDERIEIVENEKNLGLTKSLNKGLAYITSRYIARMDADDISHPDRLKVQYEFMEQHPEVGLCGTWHEDLNTGKLHRLPVNHQEIRLGLLRGNVFCHASVMFRNSVLKSNSLRYNEDFKTSQDYEFWPRLADVTTIHNISLPLVFSRVHHGQTTVKHNEEQRANAKLVMLRQLSQLCDIPADQKAVIARYWTGKPRTVRYSELVLFFRYLKRLASYNRLKKSYPPKAFRVVLREQWKKHLNNTVSNKPELIFYFMLSPNYYRLPVSRQVRLLGRTLKKIWEREHQ